MEFWVDKTTICTKNITQLNNKRIFSNKEKVQYSHSSLGNLLKDCDVEREAKNSFDTGYFVFLEKYKVSFLYAFWLQLGK